MQAHKWLSNSTKVLERIPVESRASEVHIASDGLPMMKTHGVTWLPGEDVFTLNANPPEKDFPLTKRNFLKKIAKLFDPVRFFNFSAIYYSRQNLTSRNVGRWNGLGRLIHGRPSQ